MGQANVFRGIFFVMTFFSIGVVSNFRKLWEEGIGKLAAVYVLCLFGYIIWVGLGISWIFFHGMMPPLVKGDLWQHQKMAPQPSQPRFSEEIRKMEYEPINSRRE